MGKGDKMSWKMLTEFSMSPRAQERSNLGYYYLQCDSDTDHPDLVQTPQA